MNLPRVKSRLVLLVPWFMLALSIWIVVDSDSEVRVQFERAKDFWRNADYQSAVELYQRIADRYPASKFAPQALWEIGTIEYINLYHVEAASQTFRSIVDTYPDHPLSLEALKKLGEINEVDFRDNEAAVDCWRDLLKKPLQPEVRDDALFRLGNSWFQLGELQRSQAVFSGLLKSRSLTPHLRQQVNIRLGTIAQLEHRHSEAIPFFKQALKAPHCSQCILAGQLGLIESYEFLGELRAALDVASRIDEGAYSAASKQELLERLKQKQRYFDPSWTGAK